jgi:hypothetical protein
MVDVPRAETEHLAFAMIVSSLRISRTLHCAVQLTASRQLQVEGMHS